MNAGTHPGAEPAADDRRESRPREKRTEFDLEIGNPARIETQERAAEIIRFLDGDIAKVSGHIDEYRFRLETGTETVRSAQWLQRAHCFRGLRQQQRTRVMARSRELRGIEIWSESEAMRFLRVAKQNLPTETFDTFMAAARAMITKAPHTEATPETPSQDTSR